MATYTELQQMAWSAAEIYVECTDTHLHTNNNWHGEHVEHDNWPTIYHPDHGFVIDFIPGSIEGRIEVQVTDINAFCYECELPNPNVSDLLNIARQLVDNI